MSDWRLQGQERYLKGKLLRWEQYRMPRADWDHDHCEFCQSKFAEEGDALKWGYVTEDGKHWVCEACFADFKDAFGWQQP